MKTVTNYAEKKAKQFHNLLQGYTKGIRMTAILVLLLMGVSNAWAYNFKNPHIYFNNTSLKLNPAMLLVGHNSYSIGYNQTLNPIANTNLVYFHPSADWGDQDGFTIGQGSNWGGDGSQSFTKRAAYLTNHIGLKYSYNFDYDKTYYVTGTAGNNPTISVEYKSNGYSGIPKYNATQSAKVRNTTSESYSTVNGNWPATLKLTGTYLSGNGASGRSEISSTKSTDGDNKKVYGAVVTGLITHSYSNLSDDYQFDGWGTSTPAAGNTYEYHITVATTVYAFFTKKYAVNFDVYSSNGGSISAKAGSETITSGNKVVGGTSISFTATPKTGYQVEGWYSNSACTSKITEAGTSTTYNAGTLSAAKTVYVKFKENTYTVTINNDGHGTTTPSGAQSNVGQVTGLSIQATPAANYEFVNWTITSGSGSFGSATSASTTFKPTSAATIQANFRSTATYSLTVVAGAGIESVTGSTDPVTLGSTYDIKAIPKTGYTFSTWTANPAANATFGSAETANTTVTVKNGSVTVTASATENTHNVIVSYKCGDITIQDNTTSNVGEVNAQSITAPNIDGYTFREWTLGDGITNESANTTTNPISITTKASGAYTLTATYEELPHVYFVNTAGWTTINIHAWKDGGEGTTWPGTQLTTPVETINRFDVYKYILPEGKDYNKVIFNNIPNSDGVQTADLNWENGKYYVYSANKWVDKNEVENILPKPVIYFKNHLGWKEVYVYFHQGEYWGDADNQGSGSSGLTEANGRVCKMEKVGETDIYKFDYSEKDFVPGNVIAFTKDKQADYGNFYKTEAAYRSDYNPNMELFVPQATSNETKNETKYYNKGIWMKYNSIESGYSIAGEFNGWNADPNPLVADGIGGYSFYTDVQLEAQTKYQFKILNINNDWFGKKSTDITSTTTSDIMLEVGSGDEYNVTITPQTSGTHTFTIDLIEGKLLLHVEYPVTSGDYRIVYAEKENGSTYSKFHVAQTIQKGDNTTKFVCAFVDTAKNPYILLQKWDDEWITTEEKEINLTNFPNLKGNGVYNFWVSQTNGEATIHSQIDKYTGSYYIRTNCANGGWRKYLTQDNAMTYSQKALIHGGYDYYYCKWIQHAGSNISYTIANDYSFSISDTLTTDDIADLGILPASAYVRFTWNSQTNKLERAYIGDSVEPLAIKGEGIKDAIGADKNELIPTKLNEWQYQVETKANANTNIQVVADYNSHEQYLKGTLGQPEKIISGSTTRDYQVRLIYDFRTNQLLSTLIDNNEISDNISINSIIISREHHNAAQSINITSTGSINNIENATAIITFAKETLNNISIAETERALYWISFPFPVKLSEVTGNGIYGEHWILEEYDGKARAENGCWAEDTYWKYIENSTDKMLYPHMGYVLALDLTKLGKESNVYDENDNFTIHFPSYGGAISQLTAAPIKGYSTITYLEHECTINRPTGEGDRRIKDSNWNIIGVPSFANVHDFATQVGDVNFYYQWNPADDTYSPQPAATFQTMHAYMVQFAGTIDWGAKTAVSPAAIAARRNASNRDQYTLRLVLQQEGKDQDQTFIRLLAGGATNEFDMNVDLSKIINRGANIYSLIGKEEAAANILPIEESIIPIGLDIEKAGTYTFAMPDGTDGITAILIDYETQTEHNLLTTEYTVNLNEGINNKRFALRVVPNQVATNIESLFDSNCNQNVQKYIINGQLFIKNNGHIYDIQGRQVK